MISSCNTFAASRIKIISAVVLRTLRDCVSLSCGVRCGWTKAASSGGDGSGSHAEQTAQRPGAVTASAPAQPADRHLKCTARAEGGAAATNGVMGLRDFMCRPMRSRLWIRIGAMRRLCAETSLSGCCHRAVHSEIVWFIWRELGKQRVSEPYKLRATSRCIAADAQHNPPASKQTPCNVALHRRRRPTRPTYH